MKLCTSFATFWQPLAEGCVRSCTKKSSRFHCKPSASALYAVRPQIGPPRHPWRHNLTFFRVVVQFSLSGDLIGDQPLHRESRFVGVRLRVQGHRRVAAINSAGEIQQLQIPKTFLQYVDARHLERLQIFRFPRKVEGWVLGYETPGVYFPTVRVTDSTAVRGARQAAIQNLASIRVIVGPAARPQN